MFRDGSLDNVSFLRLSQTDVVSGAYEQEIIDSCERLLDTLPHRPRVVSLHVNCIDDFLATDANYLIKELSSLHPDVFFTLTRINPISADVRNDKLQNVQSRLYEPLEPVDTHDRGITLVGHFEPIPEQSEFHQVLSDLDITPLRQLFDCKDFAMYQEMARSNLVLSLSHMGDAVANDFEGRLGVTSMQWHACYNIEEIGRNYQRLMKAVGKVAEHETYAQEARYAVESAQKIVGSRPIAVDTSGSFKPYSLALDLIDYGFNVRYVFALHDKGDDSKAMHELASLHPEVSIVEGSGACAITGFESEDSSDTFISIGTDAAFLLQGSTAVSLFHDEGCFGYQGVKWLMESLTDAALCKREG